MRLHVGLPKMFWEDSVTTAAYLIKRGPSVPLGFRIPEEEWQEKEVSLAHLRVFGCDSYVKVKDVARDKLDAKSVKCTLLGYMTYAHTSVQTSVRYIAPAHTARTNKEYKQGLRKVNVEYNRHKI
ncbi:retrovirus-related pol polyprotein from transposon TNT 1-94 [Tanacetum coccineum]|uniref:Retrovirus-related pol polyprotein from transposon TNT 1-94 n=1 Tax=Tanacetum coccineum TaxID=301880 RepID=A0ABQ4XIE0_9ASTR